MWQVIIVRQPMIFPWSDDYFPRKFHYKRDAVKLEKLVRYYQGAARVERVKE